VSEVVEQLERAACEGADPDGAFTRVARFFDACRDHGGVGACVPDEACARLFGLLAEQSPYLSAPLIRDPRGLYPLAHDLWLEREKDAATMARELEVTLAACAHDWQSGLRRYRNREYLRLGARELGYGAATEVARELAHLADVCLDAACARVYAELAARHGEPRTAAGGRCRFVVMGMGKHGAEELNFSSDVDLLYLYETDSGTVGDGSQTLHQFFVRLCERLSRAIGDVTDEGFCFRVDLRLRPEGSRGALTNSLGAAERYYEAFGRPWERQAWIKARPVAGDRDLGDEALERLRPFVWPRSGGGDPIAAVHDLMARIRAQLASPDDVKLGPGGIREVEFFVQALQLVHGGRAPALRERGTLRALDKLLFAGIVSEREHRALSAAYELLRRVEHRLQLANGTQTHTLPVDEEQRSLYARRLGLVDGAHLSTVLGVARREVGEIYATLGAPVGAPPPPIQRLLDPATSRPELVATLAELGFAAPEASADEMELLSHKPASPFSPSAAGAEAEAAPILLEEIATSPDPDLALKRLVDLVGRRRAAAVFRLAAERRPLARLLASLFGTSEFFAKSFIAHPELLEPLLSATQAAPVRPRQELDAALAQALAACDRDDEAGQLNALRRVKNEELLRIGLFDVAGEISAAQVSAQLSDLAEAILEAALQLVSPPTFRKWGTPSASLAVIGLGKLGGRELSYSSDLDVVFVYSHEGTATGGRGASNFDVMSRLAQRLIHALSAFLDEGRLYDIDTRLRPSGQEGALVSSLAGFRVYHARAAQLWERQALIKARTVAGDRGLGAEIEALAATHVYGDDAGAMPQKEVAAEIGRLRARMEKELAQETAHRFNIKVGRGGMIDVEFLVQFLQLCEGHRLPSLRVRPTGDAIVALAAACVLPAEEASLLADSYAFLRRLENRLRLVHDRSIHEITDRPDELDKLARRLGYHGQQAGARLLADYRAHTDRVRALYARYLPAP
jgi:glutamate-ammonia-ligase adenylyltransferase